MDWSAWKLLPAFASMNLLKLTVEFDQTFQSSGQSL